MAKIILEERNYALEEIKEMLSKRKYSKFLDWFEGQTGAINEIGELCVYWWDLDDFLKGLEPSD